MNRRDFLYKTAGVGLSLGLSGSVLTGGEEQPPKPAGMPKAWPDLVAVKGGEPEVMFDRAIEASGGMSRFVAKGQKVVIKPNIGWDSNPAHGANTHPGLVRRIVEQCFAAGAAKVFVFDNTCDEWTRTYENSGIGPAAKEAGAQLAPGNNERYYQKVSIPRGAKLTEASIHELILESDVFINVPVLKNHRAARLTIAMKNLMGVVWDRGYWHRNDLHRCIAEFGLCRKPTLNVVDAYRVMTQNGPRGTSEADVTVRKSLLLSTDMVAVDTAATKLFGLDPAEVPYLKMAADLGLGRMDLDGLQIRRISL